MDGAMPGTPRLSFGVVDVRDVADLHLRAMTNPAAKGERFLAIAGDFITVQEISRILKARMGERCAPRSDAIAARLDRSTRRDLRCVGEADRSGAGQVKERHQRKSEARARVGAAIE